MPTRGYQVRTRDGCKLEEMLRLRTRSAHASSNLTETTALGLTKPVQYFERERFVRRLVYLPAGVRFAGCVPSLAEGPTVSAA
jgi:hypothetical protein